MCCISLPTSIFNTEAYSSDESAADAIDMMEKMAENILTFTNAEFGSIRVIEISGQPWFIAKDVASVLGYLNTKDAIKSHVDEEDKFIVKKSDFPTLEIPNRGMVAINESGLYSLIMSSKLPTAKHNIVF